MMKKDIYPDWGDQRRKADLALLVRKSANGGEAGEENRRRSESDHLDGLKGVGG